MRFLLALAALALAVPAAAAPQKASLRVTDEEPLTVAGAGFKPRERITVRFAPSGAAAAAKAVRATLAGRFTVVFPGRKAPECAAYNVTATGSAGSRARVIEIPPPCGVDPVP